MFWRTPNSIQSSVVITGSNIIRYYLNNYRNWGRHPIPLPNGGTMGCLLRIFVRKSVITHRTVLPDATLLSRIKAPCNVIEETDIKVQAHDTYRKCVNEQLKVNSSPIWFECVIHYRAYQSPQTLWNYNLTLKRWINLAEIEYILFTIMLCGLPYELVRNSYLKNIPAKFQKDLKIFPKFSHGQAILKARIEEQTDRQTDR